jgi:hypothetical protein
VVVVAQSGGDYASIQDALDSIRDASTGNRYVVLVAPGTYTETVTMKPFVDIEGGGELATKITYAGFGDIHNGTVEGADNAELRFLTVENTGGHGFAVAIYNASASPRLTHVTATASGATYSAGVHNYESSPTIQNSVISGSGGTWNYGIRNTADSGSYTVTVTHSEITGSTGTIVNDSQFTTLVAASLLDGGETGYLTTLAGAYDDSGKLMTEILQITGGSDLAEPFDMVGAEDVDPGMVAAIDPAHPGQLRIATKAYDRAVVGCVSGANGVNPGLVMHQEGSTADGAVPVALSGRVYCWADAAYGPIQPGDLLTTSDTPGHVMVVTDYEKAQGAIIGKAMSSLDDGKALVLVLVALQ